ncbi:MAG: efflux transporter outer membrane subunit [Desulfovibrio sp.]|jgi:multidrug efflux system outer membrane protein|nr:efflux transporter outer membrane subunit [Desulfovibrio sp.]
MDPFPRKAAGAVCLCLSLFCAACTMAPAYERPAMPIPDAYGTGADMAGPAAPLPEWRIFFSDPGLQRLIELALQNNRSLRSTMENVERVRAQYQIQRADLLPTINAEGQSSNQGMPADLTMTRQRGVSRQYMVGVGMTNFEVDLWGRLRSLNEAALETWHSAREDAAVAHLALTAETASVYLQLVADRELLDIARATYRNRLGQYKLVSTKFASGVASQLEVSQAESIMREAQSQAARYASAVGQDENLLALLIGCPVPADLPEVRRLSKVGMPKDVPEGLPSSLLERRPDIRSAEHRLRAANAAIGAARANFFPAIRLTGTLGTISADYSRLFEPQTGYWAFMPSVTLPIFDTGRNIAQLEVSEAERTMAVADYEKTVQAAFREVADGLVQRRYIGEQMTAERALLKATQTAYNLASARYEAGVDSYLNVLDAQRSLFSAQQSWTATQLQRAVNALTLFKALGGGWH